MVALNIQICMVLSAETVEICTSIRNQGYPSLSLSIKASTLFASWWEVLQTLNLAFAEQEVDHATYIGGHMVILLGRFEGQKF